MLEETVCIVCGAGHGIGEEAAVAMAEHGATVVVNDLGVDVTGGDPDEDPAQETVDRIEAAGGEAVAHFGDVTDVDYTEELIAETVDRFGAVHSVANFAGVLRDRMVFNMSEADWDTVIDVHLKGHYALLHNASRHWRQRYKDEGFDRQRSFLCISSGAAAGHPGQTNYAAAKAGILGLMRTAARELYQYDVRVNAMWPAALTRMTDGLPGIGDRPEDEFGPHLVTPVPVFFASDLATDVTGCTVGLGGGDLSFISDPERERTLSKDLAVEEPWTADELAERWDELTDGLDTTKTEVG